MSIDEVVAVAPEACRFLTRAWFASSVAAYAHGSVITLIGRRADGRAVIALPTVAVQTIMPVGRAVPGSYWPFRSFPIAEDLTEEEMCSFLSNKTTSDVLGAIWRLGPVYADSPATLLLRRAASSTGWQLVVRRIATSFVLDLQRERAEGQWPRASTLKKNRYHERQLAVLGELEWRYVSGPDWSQDVLETLSTVEERSWVGSRTDRSTAKFLSPSHRRFWSAVTEDPVLAQRITAALLYIGGRPVAFSLDLNVAPVKYVIANSYDAAFAKHSPGKVLSYRSLLAAAEHGIELVDWGAGDSGYKQQTGAMQGSEVVDCLFIRGKHLGRFVARVAAPIWQRSGN